MSARLGELCSSKRAQIISLTINLIVTVVPSPIADRDPQRYGAVPCTAPELEAPHAIRCLGFLPHVTIALAPIVIDVQWRVPVGGCTSAASWLFQFAASHHPLNDSCHSIHYTTTPFQPT